MTDYYAARFKETLERVAVAGTKRVGQFTYKTVGAWPFLLFSDLAYTRLQSLVGDGENIEELFEQLRYLDQYGREEDKSLYTIVVFRDNIGKGFLIDWYREGGDSRIPGHRHFMHGGLVWHRCDERPWSVHT